MYDKNSTGRVCQGDILEEFENKFIYYQNEEKAIITITLPYAVVLTQDCDLEQDFKQRNPSPEFPASNNDKYLQSILICPAYIAEKFKQGTHLEAVGLKMSTWSGELWRYIKSNQNPRFHYLEEDGSLGISALVVDFKHYYTIPREDIYGAHPSKYKVSLATLFREDISQRFSSYLSRIGLPVIIREIAMA